METRGNPPQNNKKKPWKSAETHLKKAKTHRNHLRKTRTHGNQLQKDKNPWKLTPKRQKKKKQQKTWKSTPKQQQKNHETNGNPPQEGKNPWKPIETQPHEDKNPRKPNPRRQKLMETTPKDKNPRKPTPRRQEPMETHRSPPHENNNPRAKLSICTWRRAALIHDGSSPLQPLSSEHCRNPNSNPGAVGMHSKGE